MDDNPLSLGTLIRNVQRLVAAIRTTLFIGMVLRQYEKTRPSSGVYFSAMLLFLSIAGGFISADIQMALVIGMDLRQSEKTSPLRVVYYFAMQLFISRNRTAFNRPIRLYDKQKRCIASRLRAVIDINVREMDNLLASMKLWESRSCQKMDDYKNDEDTIMRLRRFFDAMESPELTNKIYELRGLSRDLNLVTRRRIQSRISKAIDLITTWSLSLTYHPIRVLAPRAIEVEDVVLDLNSTAIRLIPPLWPPGTLSSHWDFSEDARKLIDMAEETTRDIQSSVKSLQKKADLPDFGSVAVLSCWKLGVLSTPDEEIGVRPEHSPLVSKHRPRIVCQGDEGELVRSYCMERVEVTDVDEDGVYRGICKLCVTRTMKDKDEIFYGSGWLIDNSTVVTAAHMLYNPLNESYASKVKVEVGVTKGSYRPPEMQWGDFAAIHWGFYAARKRQNDMAMIKLKSPFHKVVPILCANAPLVETERSFLRVVGYPGNRGGMREHQGRIMHVSEGAHARGWDLKSTNYILRHHLDTVEGHSGCPLLKVGKDASFEAIAVHAGEGGDVDKSWNEAAPLGHNGNYIEAFAEALRMTENGDDARHNPGSRIEEVQDKIPGLKTVTIPL